MTRIVLFLFAFLAGLLYLLFITLSGQLPAWMDNLKLPFLCVLSGGFGGAVYCLRGVYLNACVKKHWDPVWEPWYYIRPFVSLVCGGVSYLFLKAGLLVLESTPTENSTDLGFYALAFIAGLNVDKFISKIEDLAQSIWGIEKSRTSKSDSSSPGE